MDEKYTHMQGASIVKLTKKVFLYTESMIFLGKRL